MSEPSGRAQPQRLVVEITREQFLRDPAAAVRNARDRDVVVLGAGNRRSVISNPVFQEDDRSAT